MQLSPETVTSILMLLHIHWMKLPDIALLASHGLLSIG